MNNSGMTVTKYIVDEQARCVDVLIYDDDVFESAQIYLRVMQMFQFLVRVGYMFDKTGLQCRLDAVNIRRALIGRGARL